ncbi:fused MFS/spermidine synthase [Pseudonocardia abyssalis]|uniref:Fused MFS/spermidine synthase n=1 Tax=Pseudonocardia abyssalis TaxID=2792008 RepID=A0ABS6UYV8_9PSEU|nr:fused MFS/spermidine synthase [Pseudonocardia abyssalis]MBW0118262.1 fused MFS/spermidine synthase [Pseudonocardia abyssalis]MBW0137342.1 fused MFS/spermidine synthase [Pseudonocardia abyssalis]
MNARFARFVVLVSGAAILVVETLATRLVAPYVGLTLESTTAVIGVALAGIAVGASLGGRWADVFSPRRVAAGALAVGGLGVLAVRPLVRLLGPVLGPGPVAAILLVAASTLVSVTALAMVTPAITRARLTTVDGSGSVIGELSAAGTIGSLAGTFLTGFVLVTFLPVTAILLITAAACLLLALLVVEDARRSALVRGGVATLLLAVALVAVPGRCDADTVYYCARVDTDPERASAQVLVLDDLRHSYVDRADPAHLEFAYTQRFGGAIDAAFPAGEPLRAVHVGGGGFTMPRWLAATRPGSTSTVLEVDQGVVDLGRRELGVGEIPALDVRVGDARTTLAELPDGSADLVVGDAFGARSVPWHLATTEFVDEVRRVLRPGGLYVLNIIDRDPRALLAAETATVAGRFVTVALLIRPDQLSPGSGGNAVLVASDRAPDLAALAATAAARGEPGSVLDDAATRALAADAPVLTDDRAPVDQLQT